MAAFQIAIEKRAAWLYRHLYEELGFADWMRCDIRLARIDQVILANAVD